MTPTIDEKTKVPLLWIFSILIVLVPIIAWAVNVDLKSDKGVEAHKEIIELKSDVKVIRAWIDEQKEKVKK